MTKMLHCRSNILLIYLNLASSPNKLVIGGTQVGVHTQGDGESRMITLRSLMAVHFLARCVARTYFPERLSFAINGIDRMDFSVIIDSNLASESADDQMVDDLVSTMPDTGFAINFLSCVVATLKRHVVDKVDVRIGSCEPYCFVDCCATQRRTTNTFHNFPHPNKLVCKF
jgi:hypothetical protein